MNELDRMPEAKRNRLLRRVDWRFLLRQVDEPHTLCLAGGRLAQAAAVLWPRPAHGTAADLAVVVEPSRQQLTTAMARLRVGGELYAEWYRPRLGGPDAVRRRLEGAGFTDVRFYWSWPPPGRNPQFWVPLDAVETLDFFLRSRRRVGRCKRLVGELWRRAARLGLLAPFAAVARKPDGTPLGEDVSLILLTGGRRSTNKVVGLRLAHGASAPEAVVKFARSSGEEEPLRREQRVLETLERTRPDLPGVPRSLSVDTRCGRLALEETALPGRPLQERLSPQTYTALAHAVTDWLVELAGKAEPQARASWWDRLVGEPLAFLEQRFGVAVSPEELDRAHALLATLPALPVICEQRDCAPWNVLVSENGDIAVLDWESAEPSGLPVLDLTYFLTYASLLVDRALATGRIRETYAACRDPATVTGGVVRSCETSYCERLGLDREALAPLRLLCWTVHARSDYRQLRGDAAAPPTGDALRRSVFLTLWREELRRQSS